MTLISDDLSEIRTYLKKVLIAKTDDEKELKKNILEWIDDVKDMIKVMKRLIIERLFDNLFSKGRKEVAPKLGTINSLLKKFGATIGVSAIFSEIFERIT